MIKLKDLLFEINNDSNNVAAVCLFFSSRLLACKRTGSYWSVPKGHIRKGEDPAVGAKREFYEETKIHLGDGLKLEQTTDKEDGGKFYLYTYESDQRYTPQLDYEHEDWRYVDVNVLPRPFDESIVKYLND